MLRHLPKFLVLLALTVIPFASHLPARAQGEPISIGSKNFTEQLILGEMYAQLLENAGLSVERNLNLGGTDVAHQALTAGEIDLYPEYTGTGLVAILKLPVPTADASASPVAGSPVASPAAAATVDQQVYDTVKAEYQSQFGLVWLDQSSFNNTQALAMKRDEAESRGIVTISDMVAQADQLTLAAVPDFEQREDGLVGLTRVYGDFSFAEVQVFDPGIKYQSFLDGDAQVVLAFSTDGQIAGYDLIVLEDDRSLWPPYHVAPVIRQEVLDANPQIAEILNPLAPLLTNEVMAELNWLVDGPEKQEPADVARAYLQANGLLPA